ncbi:general stress protein 26 [Elusimicrobium posterum]|uniref:pyridoxamine 5'-phosphate oxidase family protein n=1 Tax=Elusimicrobium posterum TaxID=3116653 RepID=UPI003C79148F
MPNKIIKKAEEIIAKRSAITNAPGQEPFCVIALLNENGSPTVSTITAAKTDGIKTLTFGTGLSSNKVKRIKKDNRASVCFSAPDYNITLVGTVSILTDIDTKKENWYHGMSHHFTGPEDEQFCILKFETQSYNLLVDWVEVSGAI